MVDEHFINGVGAASFAGKRIRRDLYIKENNNRRSNNKELFVKFQSDNRSLIESIQLRIDGVERCYKDGG